MYTRARVYVFYDIEIKMRRQRVNVTYVTEQKIGKNTKRVVECVCA